VLLALTLSCGDDYLPSSFATCSCQTSIIVLLPYISTVLHDRSPPTKTARALVDAVTCNLIDRVLLQDLRPPRYKQRAPLAPMYSMRANKPHLLGAFVACLCFATAHSYPRLWDDCEPPTTEQGFHRREDGVITPLLDRYMPLSQSVVAPRTTVAIMKYCLCHQGHSDGLDHWRRFHRVVLSRSNVSAEGTRWPVDAAPRCSAPCLSPWAVRVHAGHSFRGQAHVHNNVFGEIGEK
jgi:hypothetical protein